ncbi:hypothetical protein JCM10207_005023 [Rhodosporidiobolus poonsookiae]
MNQQAAYLLREFYAATHWNTHDNHYASLTHPSRQLLDFSIPAGLNLSLASRPTDHFASSLNLASLVPDAPPTYPPTVAPVLGPPVSPLLAGQLSYSFSSVPLLETSTKRAQDYHRRIRFKDVVQSYPLGSVPVKPQLREDALPTWQGGVRVDKADFLLYGRLYAPSPRLDALYVHRLSPSLQALVSLISVPSPAPPPTLGWESTDPSAPSAAVAAAAAAAQGATSGPLARLSELEVKVQQDTGRWSAEYSYAVGDGMFGLRGLYNFGRWGEGAAVSPPPLPASTSGAPPSALAPAAFPTTTLDTSDAPPPPPPAGTDALPTPDDEDEMPSGLKGRWSAGGELYISKQERSAGVSTGVRFTTLPESAGGPPQPPTTITAALNPIMGQLSAAYAVQVGRDAALASRFDFNLYSYDADVTIGGEWFQRKKRRRDREVDGAGVEVAESAAAGKTFDAFGRGVDEEEDRRRRRNTDKEDEVIGVLKARASTNSDIALLWEGRLGDFLVSLGLVADLRLATHKGGRVSPLRSIGLGISYWA